MMGSDRLRPRGPMERLLFVGIARSVPIGVVLFLILDFLGAADRGDRLMRIPWQSGCRNGDWEWVSVTGMR